MGGEKKYIGSTSRHTISRISEHAKDHLHQHHTDCSQSTNTFKTSFTLIANNIHNHRKLLIVEAMHIKLLKPTINIMHRSNDTYNTHILKT